MVNIKGLLSLLFSGVCTSVTRAEDCQDTDPLACTSLIHINASLCLSEVFAHTACKRSCGKCGQYKKENIAFLL